MSYCHVFEVTRRSDKQGNHTLNKEYEKKSLLGVMKDLSFLRVLYTLKMYGWKIND